LNPCARCASAPLNAAQTQKKKKKKKMALGTTEFNGKDSIGMAGKQEK
jgi:hypothetical protein